ncbi:PilZ domain-containing protein [Arenimonas oryziterrae]|uniref:PilZ domain-containing protein n=1 Tax=Arenimonas oryziterrae DSM 21050 = YC6267 TaxID=1121015 RepID=A0A091AWE2_9GAMM|nr:PilZ domain-containing protein [Arenimonas oryziterrae]KFN44618.1 hypothetical protein N789_01010 [Arenimonas oryziterrae DSM 21050 = YC6267]
MSFFERRQAPREAKQVQALVVRGTTAFQVDVADLSKGGACVKRPRNWPFNIGDAVFLYLVGSPGPVMAMEARVIWFKDDEIGLQYL